MHAENSLLFSHIFLTVKFPSDCKALKIDGTTRSGDYPIYLGGSLIKVFCDMSVDGGGWTVFQRRKDGSVDFHRNWKDYENGFGDVTGDFWLGNKWIHALTSLGTTELRIDFDGGRYVKYTKFSVGDAASKYKLTESGYSGSAGLGDQLNYYHNNMKFSTYDQDNDGTDRDNCALLFKGGWWYNDCYWSILNGVFSEMIWTGHHTFTEMKLRRV